MSKILEQIVADSHDVNSQISWRALQVFNLYRFALVIFLIVVFAFNFEFFPLGREDSVMYFNVTWSYLIIAMVSITSALLKKPNFQTQVFTQVIIDIIMLTLLMYTSHGAIAVLGILINAAIAGGSILTQGRTSIFFAAIASISILLEHAYASLKGELTIVNYTQIGVIGITFFATAILGYTLSRRIRLTEEIASQRGADLAEMEKLNEYIVQQIRSGIITVNSQGRVELMNDYALELLALPKKVIGKQLDAVVPLLAEKLDLWQTFHKEEINPFVASVNGAEVLPQFVPLGTQGGTVIFIDDMSRISQQAQQLKLASLGRLTASIAHEIRNPLGAVSHAAQLLEESTNLDNQDKRLLEIITKQADRMNGVVKNVLQLSRRKDSEIVLFRIKPWLQDFIHHFTSNKEVDITINVIPPEIEVYMDASQLNQVLTNLCENGLRYSYQNTGEWTLLINVGINSQNNRVFLDIIDQGEGISDDDIIAQIFEPFYTTEKTGTGLGLYVAKELCDSNKAILEYLKLEAGSCFRIQFQRSPYEIRGLD